MTSETEAPLSILVVEDERDLADLYGQWLADEYDVRIAYDGSQALAAIDPSIDIVLLDRRMPGMSGDEVLDAIRERGIDCRVAMVTAVDPDFDIVDMPFDTYLVKPVSRDDLLNTIEQLQRRSTFDDTQREFYAIASKQAALEAEKSQNELEHSDEYQALLDQLDDVRDQLDGTLAEFEEHDYTMAFKNLDANK